MLTGRRTRWFVMLPLVAASTTGLVAANRPETITGCQSATAWVALHRGQLPTTYAEIIRYPWELRKSIQAALPWSIRREMWHAQFRAFQEDGALTTEQARFVAGAELSLDELLGDKTTQARRQALGDSLVAASLKVLGRDLTHSVFYALGPDDSGSKSGPGPSIFRYALAHPVSIPGARFNNCVCHWMSDGISPPECPSGYCHNSDCEASQIESGGCGPNGTLDCNSKCV